MRIFATNCRQGAGDGEVMTFQTAKFSLALLPDITATCEVLKCTAPKGNSFWPHGRCDPTSCLVRNGRDVKWNDLLDQRDATVMIYWGTDNSTCFGHHCAHLQECKAIHYCIWFSALKVLAGVLGRREASHNNRKRRVKVKVKVNAKFILQQAMKAQSFSKGVSLLFL